MSATGDWGPDIWPDHYWHEGCCELEQAAHPSSPAEVEEWNQWAATEPGLLMRLELRQAQLARLEELGAPEVILENQRRMIREVKEQLKGS
jgi:hypothetical protein